MKVAGLCLAALALGAAGCSSVSNGSGAAAVKSAAASLSANPQFQAAKDRLNTNMRKDFHPTHPKKSLEAVLTETFPGAHIQPILLYGVKTFKAADRKAGPARTAWENGVVLFALQQSARGVSGQPSIPGVTGSASPNASHS
jgi:hypothetical protein